jgi:serine/threonine protein kinase
MARDGETEIDPPSQAGDLLDDPRVWELVTEFQNELKSGRRPDRAAYVKRYPELAAAVAECLDGLQMLNEGLSSDSSPPPKPALPLLPDAVASAPSSAPLGDFQIIGEIARGGMGVVYEAKQLSLGRRVALKVLPFASTLDPRHLQRFKIEAQAAALLHHTHIVPIYYVGCERGVHFYAMQLIEGQSLATVLHELRVKEGRTPQRGVSSNIHDLSQTHDKQVAPTTQVPSAALHSTADVSVAVTAGNALASEGYLRRTVRLMIQAAEALEHAHQSGVVHRDIKPANLLIDRAGNLWITDFGLAQLQNENGMTRSHDMLGTFRYMSPEQTGGHRAVLDHRTDIYSLGATFYELATLEPAFNAASHQELFYQILHAEPRRPSELNRALPAELDTIILKALSKNPAERYATAGEMAADLQRYLDHKPILARPPTTVDRLRKWSRRHPSIVIAGVLLLGVVAAGSLVGAWLIGNEQLKTAAALEGEKLRAQEAETRFAQARQAVDTLFQISEEELTDKLVEGTRKRILEVVLSHYEDFIEQRKGDEASQAELARVQDKVKNILHELNVLQSAMDHRLFEHKSVQQELQLSNSQQEQLNQWLAETRKFHDTMRRTISPEREALVAFAERQEAELESLLTADQLTRFRQLVIQSRGLFAFKDRDLIRTLALTAEQSSRIRDIEREMFFQHFRPPGSEERRPPPDGPRRREPGDNEGRRGELRGPRPDAIADGEPRGPGRGDRPGGPPHRRPRDLMPMQIWVDKALTVLTPEQLAKWQTLTGEPLAGIDAVGFPGPPR